MPLRTNPSALRHWSAAGAVLIGLGSGAWAEPAPDPAAKDAPAAINTTATSDTTIDDTATDDAAIDDAAANDKAAADKAAADKAAVEKAAADKAANDKSRINAAAKGDPSAIGSRTDKPDGSTAITVGRRLPTAWDTKVGVDFGLAPPPAATPVPDAYIAGRGPQDRSSGVGWASVAIPADPTGWEKAAVEARIDPTQDQGKLATTLSRSLPLGDDAKLTVKNGYSLTETLVNPGGIPLAAAKAGAPVVAAPSTQSLATEGQVSLDIPSGTTFGAGAKLSTTDGRWLRTLSAEQKLFGGPFSVTGAISERPTGETDRSVKAGFKFAW